MALQKGEVRLRGNPPPRGGLRKFLASHKGAASEALQEKFQKIRENVLKNHGEAREARSYSEGIDQYENQGGDIYTEMDTQYIAKNKEEDPAFYFYQIHGGFEQYLGDFCGGSTHMYPFDLENDDISIDEERSDDDESDGNPHIGEPHITRNKLNPKEEYHNIDKAASDTVVQSKLGT